MIKKYIYFVVAILVTNVNLYAQFSVKGIIKDQQTKETMPGVSVYISDLKLGVISDETGSYELSDLKTGNYLLEVSYLGYKSNLTHVFIYKDTIIDFDLNVSHKELREVVITGVSRTTEIKRNPVIIKSLDKNYLNQSTSSNLIDALKDVPGISQITTGASISKPVIRGLGYNRVISLLNGIKQEGQQWGDEHGIEIDEYSIDKIEIIKGPGSLMYGSDGIAGVINFLSPKAPTIGQITTQLATNYQTNNNMVGYSLSNAGNKNGWQWLGRFSNKFAGNYKNSTDGKVLNSGFNEYNGNLFLGLNRNWGHSHLHINTFNATMNLPEGERDSLGNFVFENVHGMTVSASKSDLSGYKIGFPHQGVNHLRISSNNYFLLKNGTINLDLGFQNNKRKEYASIAHPEDIELFFNLNTFNYNVRYNLRKINGWETSFGISGMQQSHTNKGEEYLIPDYKLFDIGAFIFTQKSFLDKWTFAGGLRFDTRRLVSDKLILDSLGKATSIENNNTTLKFYPIKESFFGLSGSVGLTYQTSNISTLKLNISRGFRAPNISELSSNGRHEGTFRYELGNSKLNPEISHQIDLAYFINSDHVVFELTPFVNFISNYIYTNKLTDSLGNDIILNPEDPAPAFEFTHGNATLWGGEIYLDVHPHPFDWLHFANSFSFVQAQQINASDSTRYLPFIPAPKYKSELKLEFNKVGTTISNAYLKFGLEHFFTQNKIYSAYGTETKTPGYTLLSVGIGANLSAYKKPDFMSIFFNVENLADIAYQSHLSRLKYAPINPATGEYGIFNQGRNISLKILLNI